VLRPETFEQAARRIVAVSTIRTKDERLSRLVRYAFEQLGAMPVVDIKARHIKAVLVSAQAELGGPTTTVGHLLHDISSVLADLWREEAIAENPAKRVRTEAAKVKGAPRVVLSDAEFERFVTSEDVDGELRIMALTSRCLGGMRSSDLHAWSWEHVDTTNWVSVVPRKKTDKAQAGAARHAIPELLVAPLRDGRSKRASSRAPCFLVGAAREQGSASRQRLTPPRFAKRCGLPAWCAHCRVRPQEAQF
jgi:integrase